MEPCAFTGIGSLPFRSGKRAVSYVFENYEIPFLPQLSGAFFQERMIYQALENFPGFTCHRKRAFIDLDRFFPQDPQEIKFSFSSFSSHDFFLKTLHIKKVKSIKIQIAGPFTIASSLSCSDSKPVIAHRGIYNYLLKFLYFKIKAFLKLFPSHLETILIFDEPCLFENNASFVFKRINFMVHRLRKEDSRNQQWYGLHSCNEWTKKMYSMFYKGNIDILSFDIQRGVDVLPFRVTETFLKRGWILWGIIPTSHDRTSGVHRADVFIRVLENKGLKKNKIVDILRRSMFSPACGTAMLSVRQERKCVEHLKRISSYNKDYYEKGKRAQNERSQ